MTAPSLEDTTPVPIKASSVADGPSPARLNDRRTSSRRRDEIIDAGVDAEAMGRRRA
jgi:hypothetical protein